MRGPLPASVVERCAATDGTHGGCHGADASGVNDLAFNNAAESLAALKQDMGEKRRRWLAAQIVAEEARA